MEHLTEILWLTLWPIVIWLGYKLSFKNIQKFEEKNQK